MLSFHNDEKVKARHVARLEEHAKSDEIIKGKYWEKGKGCAVGCTIHNNTHASYETELGLPEWLARLEDTLFEGLDNRDAKVFAVDFLKVIPVGVNVDSVKWRFCAYLMRENIERVLALDLSDTLKTQIVEAIRTVLALHEQAMQTGQWPESAAESAESAARSAAESAESAARSAAWSARSAAWSAESAARSAAYKRHAAELLRLLKEETPTQNIKNVRNGKIGKGERKK